MTANLKISQSELSRRLNLPEPKLRKAVRAGLIQPDETFGRYHLYRLDRLPEIQRALQPVASEVAA